MDLSCLRITSDQHQHQMKIKHHTSHRILVRLPQESYDNADRLSVIGKSVQAALLCLDVMKQPAEEVKYQR